MNRITLNKEYFSLYSQTYIFVLVGGGLFQAWFKIYNTRLGITCCSLIEI